MNVNRHTTYSLQADIARSSNAPFLASDARWLEEFRMDINMMLSQIEQRFNALIDARLPVNEQIKKLNELIGFVKHIQVTCSAIQSSSIVEKQRELKLYADQLISKSQRERDQRISPPVHQNLTRLLYDLLVTLVNYVHTYCHAYLIPFHVELYNDEHGVIDIEQLKYPVSTLLSNIGRSSLLVLLRSRRKTPFHVRSRSHSIRSRSTSTVSSLSHTRLTSRAFACSFASATATRPSRVA